MTKIFSLILIASLTFLSNAYAKTASTSQPAFTHLDKIAAVVNREVITQSQLQREVAQYQKQLEQTGQPLPSPAQLRKQALDNLIARSLQAQLSRAKNLTIPDEDVDKAISHVASTNHLTMPQLKQAVEHIGLAYKDYREQIREQIMFQKLQQEEVGKKMTFTPQDVQDFIKANKGKLTRYNSFHVIDILLPIAENASRDQLNSLNGQALTVQTQLQKGKSIEEILTQYPSAQKNDLGWRALGELPSIFQAKVAAMNIKSISAPIAAPNGFHILALMEAKGENPKPTERDLKNMAYQYKLMNASKEWVLTLRKKAYIQIMP